MTCEHFSEARGLCGKGMPVGTLYVKLICRRSPAKCPLVAAGVGFERAGAGLGLFEGF